MKAVEIPGGDIEHQAQVMAEEFRDMGTDKKKLLQMFRDPFYGGLNIVTVQLGEDAVEKIINQVYDSNNYVIQTGESNG
ncbi:uncharacterized protein METZ01_LOCUS150776 [marine metagenome]|uniref:Uncharacterized protein n=1 Tax=marine metagenome TaxID=408172 RepID=A0A382A9Y6_9ZZZZ